MKEEKNQFIQVEADSWAMNTFLNRILRDRISYLSDDEIRKISWKLTEEFEKPNQCPSSCMSCWAKGSHSREWCTTGCCDR